MNFHLRIWKQEGQHEKGHFENIEARDISEDASFLEMLDIDRATKRSHCF